MQSSNKDATHVKPCSFIHRFESLSNVRQHYFSNQPSACSFVQDKSRRAPDLLAVALMICILTTKYQQVNVVVRMLDNPHA